MPLLILILSACGIRNTDTPDDSLVDGGDDSNPVLHNYSTEVAALYDKDSDGYLATETPQNILDQINDGYYANTPSEVKLGDCNDDPANGGASVNPGATEIPYDGIDQDCKDGDLVDVDGDGYDAGARGSDDDCDDDNSAVNPSMAEISNNGVDDNCDGQANKITGTDLVLDDLVADGLAIRLTGESEGAETGHSIVLSGAADNSFFVTAPAASGSTGYENIGKVYMITPPVLGNMDLATDATAVFTSSSTDALGDGFGYAVANVENFDGTGGDAVLIGSSGGRDYTGTVYLFADGTRSSGNYTADDADSSVSGGHYDLLGNAINSAGDINNDGMTDVWVGAFFENYVGAVYLLGGNAENRLDNTLLKFTAGTSNLALGTALATTGDVDFDGDGLPDLLIGDFQYGSSHFDEQFRAYFYQGAAYIVPSSGMQSVLSSEISVDNIVSDLGGTMFYGASFDSLSAGQPVINGDINNDGYADILIGGPTSSNSRKGAAYLYYGSDILGKTKSTDQADIIFNGEDTDDYAGFGTSFVPSADGDRDGILIGATMIGGGAGKSYLFYSDQLTSGVMSLANASAKFNGAGIVQSSDVTDDGVADILLGTPDSHVSGAAYVYPGIGF